MSVSAKKHSRASTKRGRNHLALVARKLSVCSHCGKNKLPHIVCPACGYYRGKLVTKVKVTKSKSNTK